MQQKQNIGTVDRYFRLMSGLLMYSAGTSVSKKNPLGRTALFALGAMKVAEGIVGWCPIVALTQGTSSQTNTNRQNAGRNTHQAMAGQASAQWADGPSRQESGQNSEHPSRGQAASHRDSSSQNRNSRDGEPSRRSSSREGYAHDGEHHRREQGDSASPEVHGVVQRQRESGEAYDGTPERNFAVQ